MPQWISSLHRRQEPALSDVKGHDVGTGDRSDRGCGGGRRHQVATQDGPLEVRANLVVSAATACARPLPRGKIRSAVRDLGSPIDVLGSSLERAELIRAQVPGTPPTNTMIVETIDSEPTIGIVVIGNGG